MGRRPIFRTLMWRSLYIYAIENTHKQMKSPIEKKLTDNLKLSKWDDQSYYSLKSLPRNPIECCTAL